MQTPVEARAPAISIVLATYGRSAALAYAIESVRRQTFGDWELIVVGDACAGDTGEIVAHFADPRIRFINLERNVGGQAGPNNIGVAEARAPLIAFLHHDDLWLPNHLKLCREALLAEQADFVFGTAANIRAHSPVPLGFDTVRIALDGLGVGGTFRPEELYAGLVPASCWLLRREIHDKLGGWRIGRESYIAPSQDFLFRVWRARHRMRALNQVTLVVIDSGVRSGSYVQDDAPEQQWVLSHLEEPNFAIELSARALESNEAFNLRMGRRPSRWVRALCGVLARLGFNPLDLHAILGHKRRGSATDRLRRIRGLSVFAPPEGTGAALRFNMVRQQCRVSKGVPIEFAAGKGGACFLATGWSLPESWGVWNDGPEAELLFDLGKPPAGEVMIDLTFRTFYGVMTLAREIDLSAGPDWSDSWTLVPGDDTKRQLAIPASAASGSFLRIRLDFGSPMSPYSLGQSNDRRELALGLITARLDWVEQGDLSESR